MHPRSRNLSSPINVGPSPQLPCRFSTRGQKFETAVSRLIHHPECNSTLILRPFLSPTTLRIENISLPTPLQDPPSPSMYRIWLPRLSEWLGWRVECETLRISSTRNWVVVDTSTFMSYLVVLVCSLVLIHPSPVFLTLPSSVFLVIPFPRFIRRLRDEVLNSRARVRCIKVFRVVIPVGLSITLDLVQDIGIDSPPLHHVHTSPTHPGLRSSC
ncbi:hypothetical protein BV22DRAFT_833621 [Leucogyrophana mollusca]|uniref:Uncharacterized protein n=1 Tax=Leucogyrophana mollusca TaxID=85980 RepID=A0ACB8B2K5_9AGAM|nr:hypothetical protein BV22DRAFT_833621 [Leucogyrophana mollusca]